MSARRNDLMAAEPAVTIGTVGAAVSALITLAVAFGVPITPEQAVAILGVVGAVGPLVVAYLIRRKVWSPRSLADIVPDHAGAGPAPEDVQDEPGQHRRER